MANLLYLHYNNNSSILFYSIFSITRNTSCLLIIIA
jgi:hypothetical protein